MTKAKKDPVNYWAIRVRGKNILVAQPEFMAVPAFRMNPFGEGRPSIFRRAPSSITIDPRPQQERAYTVGAHARDHRLRLGLRTEDVLRGLTRKGSMPPFDRYVFLPMKNRPLPGHRLIPT